jgi:hypothetical protein
MGLILVCLILLVLVGENGDGLGFADTSGMDREIAGGG